MKKYENYVAALEVLRRAPEQDLSNEFVQSGVIDKFTVQFELGWKLLKRLLAYEGEAVAETGSPRDIVKAAAALYDFMDEDAWLSMLRDHNKTMHIYDADEAAALLKVTLERYIPEFERLRDGLLARYGEMLTAPDA